MYIWSLPPARSLVSLSTTVYTHHDFHYSCPVLPAKLDATAQTNSYSTDIPLANMSNRLNGGGNSMQTWGLFSDRAHTYWHMYFGFVEYDIAFLVLSGEVLGGGSSNPAANLPPELASISNCLFKTHLTMLCIGLSNFRTGKILHFGLNIIWEIFIPILKQHTHPTLICVNKYVHVLRN